jgi:hypothetical protein
MAQAVIRDSKNNVLQNLADKSARNTKISPIDHNSVVIDISNKTKNVKAKNYPITKINDIVRNVAINQVLPFRIKFTTVTIPGYGPNNPAPIGIAVIGVNNYIL